MDYVVAYDPNTKQIIKMWTGERFRKFDPSKVHQIKLASCASREDAQERATRIINRC